MQRPIPLTDVWYLDFLEEEDQPILHPQLGITERRESDTRYVKDLSSLAEEKALASLVDECAPTCGGITADELFLPRFKAERPNQIENLPGKNNKDIQLTSIAQDLPECLIPGLHTTRQIAVAKSTATNELPECLRIKYPSARRDWKRAKIQLDSITSPKESNCRNPYKPPSTRTATQLHCTLEHVQMPNPFRCCLRSDNGRSKIIIPYEAVVLPHIQPTSPIDTQDLF
jgi:hypothetical protein